MTVNRLLIFGLSAALLSACVRFDTERAVGTQEDIVIRDVTILTGPDFVPQHAQDVLVASGRIVDVRATSSAAPAGAAVIEGNGGYLIPGLVDMHAHILVPRCRLSPGVTRQFDIELSERMLEHLLDSGITTIRSPANPTEQGLALRDRANSGRVPAPFIRAAAELINDPRLSPDAMREQIRQVLPFRPDYIKLYARIGPEALQAGINEAHANGIPVIGHLGSSSWTDGARAGIDFLTHAADWSPKTLAPQHRARYERDVETRGAFRARITWLELLDLDSVEVRTMLGEVGRRHIAIDPTLVAYEAKFSPPDDPRFRANTHRAVLPELLRDWELCGTGADDWTADDFARWRAAAPKLARLLRQLHAAGARILVGTDVTNPWVIPGESLNQEMELLVEAGFSTSEVMRMATINAAQALALDDQIGRIAIGYQADLVLLSRNPLADISRMREVRWVMEDGVVR